MTPQELKAMLPSTADNGMATHILDACRATGLSVSDALTLCEKESGFRNVFGHDPTRSLPVKWRGKHVTRFKYRFYRARRRRGLGMQGVGPTQLTWFAYQDMADSLGGCWRPYPNMCVGFRHLHDLIVAHGREHGAALYNGTGPAAEAYGRDFIKRQIGWHRRLSA